MSSRSTPPTKPEAHGTIQDSIALLALLFLYKVKANSKSGSYEVSAFALHSVLLVILFIVATAKDKLQETDREFIDNLRTETSKALSDQEHFVVKMVQDCLKRSDSFDSLHNIFNKNKFAYAWSEYKIQQPLESIQDSLRLKLGKKLYDTVVDKLEKIATMDDQKIIYNARDIWTNYTGMLN